MATKTWKIGEYSRGGVITAEVSSTKITLISKLWDFSTGSRRSSSQTNAKELDRIEVDINDNNAQRKLTQWLNEDTTHYYSEQVMDWVRSKANLTKQLFWF